MSHAPTKVSRRRFLGGALGAVVAAPAVARRAGAQAKPTITYWNGLTGADGKVMDELNRPVHPRDRDQGRAAAHHVAGALREAPGVGAGRGGAGPRADPPRGDPPLRERRHPRSDGRGHAGSEGVSRRGLHPVDLAGRDLPGEALLDPPRRPAAHPLLQREDHEGRRARRAGRPAEGAVERGRAGGDGEADRQGRHVRVRARGRSTSASTRLASTTCSGRTGRTSMSPTSSVLASPSRRPSRRPSSGERSTPSTRWRRPRTRTPATPSSAGKLGMWLAGSWNFTGLRTAKVDFAVAPGASPLEAARRLDDPAPVRVPQAQGCWTRPSGMPP